MSLQSTNRRRERAAVIDNYVRYTHNTFKYSIQVAKYNLIRTIMPAGNGSYTNDLRALVTTSHK